MNHLKVCDLSKDYGDGNALSNFSFEITGGEIVGLIGRNGAGKTTLLNCIAGNIYPSKGEIYVDDMDLLQNGQIRKDIGILVESTFIDYLTAYENLKLLMFTSDILNNRVIEEEINKVLEIVGLMREKKKNVSEFSYGMKQRLGFAQALLNGKKILILDEPFAGLDINGRQIVKNHIRKIVEENNISVLFSDHNLDEVKDLCNRVICIQNGVKLYDGKLEIEKTYKLIVENINEKLYQELGLAGVSVDLTERSICFSDQADMNQTLQSILNNTKIIDMQLHENSIEKLLKEDAI